MPLSDEQIKALIDSEMAEYHDGAYADHGSARDQLERFARAIESAATAPLLAQIAALEAQLLEARKADMFWNRDDAERPHQSIDCFLNDQICQHDLEVGAEFTIWRARKLTSVKIRVTAIDDEQCEAEYEAIDASIAQEQK